MNEHILRYNIYGTKVNINKLTCPDIIKQLHDMDAIDFPETFTLCNKIEIFDVVLGYCGIPPLRIKNIDFLDKYPLYAIKYLTYDVEYILRNTISSKQLYEFYLVKRDSILYNACLQYKEVYVDFILYHSKEPNEIFYKISMLDLTYEKIEALLDIGCCISQKLLRRFYDIRPDLVKDLIEYGGKEYYDESYIITKRIESLYDIVDIKYTSMEIALRCNNNILIKYCTDTIAIELYNKVIKYFTEYNDAMKECILLTSTDIIMQNIKYLDCNRACYVLRKTSIKDMLDYAYEFNQLYPDFVFKDSICKYVFNNIIDDDMYNLNRNSILDYPQYENFLPHDNFDYRLDFIECNAYEYLRHMDPKYYPRRLRTFNSNINYYIIKYEWYVYINDEITMKILDELNYAEKPFIAYSKYLTGEILDKCSHIQKWWIVRELIKHRSISIDCQHIKNNIDIISNNIDKFIGIYDWLDKYLKR